MCLLLRGRKNVMSLSQNVDLLDRFSRGESAAFVARYFVVKELTAITLKKKKTKRQLMKGSWRVQYPAPMWFPTLGMFTYMSLSVWFQDIVQSNISLRGPLIHQKAKCVTDNLVGTGGAAITSDSGMSNAGTSDPSPFKAPR